MWHAHTKHCRYCLDAHRNVQRAKRACVAAFVASAALLPHGAARAVTAIGAALMAAALHKLAGLFHRYEYSHS